MRRQRNLHLVGVLLGLALLPGAALAGAPTDCGCPAEQAPARTTVHLEFQVPALGIDWTGSMSVMHRGAIAPASPAGSQAIRPRSGPDAEAPSLMDLAWDAMRFLQAVSRVPAGLARLGLRQLF